MFISNKIKFLQSLSFSRLVSVRGGAELTRAAAQVDTSCLCVWSVYARRRGPPGHCKYTKTKHNSKCYNLKQTTNYYFLHSM